jgi:radical SAM superfamily enzyme YgiQ (UPF0313 family)
MIVFYNPLSTTPGKQPLPLSLLSLAAALPPETSWTLVDGNLVADPAAAIVERLARVPAREVSLLAVTVMPGPQLTQAVTVCRQVRRSLPHVPIAWGGYFPTQHSDTVLRSPFVDFVVRGQGERPFVELLETLRADELGTIRALPSVSSLSWKTPDGRVVRNPSGAMTPLDDLPELPYGRVRMADYIHPSYLGRRTIAHNSSFGCPFSCSFCAVVAMSSRRWLAQSPVRMERVLRQLSSTYGVDAVQMHDMDFFISEARTAEFAQRIAPLGLGWWGLGRIDTLMQYRDRTWQAMARSGLRMVFCGAESGSESALAAMNKGGRASPNLTLELARRLRTYGVVPEFSFVLGSPPDPLDDMELTFEFIRKIKRENPATEIVLYTYTPVPIDGSPLFAEASRLGFAFPTTLDEWASEKWRELAMRRGKNIPWMNGTIRRRVHDFERVLNAYYPTVTDRRLTGLRRRLLRAASAWRYTLKVYAGALELRALQRVMRYQRPETTGF